MASRANAVPGLLDAVKSAADGLVRVRHWGDYCYVNLPLIYPSGSFKIAAAADVEANRRALFADASADDLQRALCDVAIASWNVADKVFAKAAEQEENARNP